MDTDSKYIYEPTFSFKALSQPRIILTAWFVGFWFSVAIVFCIVDYRMTQDPFDKVSGILYMIGYYTALAQMLCIFVLGFFATRRHWLFTPLLSILGVLATLALFRIFITPYRFEPWILYVCFPVMFFFVSAVVSPFTMRQPSQANPTSAFQVSIVDAFLLMFIMACFLSLMKIAIFDLSFAFWDDLDKMRFMVNPYPELVGRMIEGACMAIIGLTYVSQTKLQRPWRRQIALLVTAIVVYAAINALLTLLVYALGWGGTATNLEYFPRYFWNSLFTSTYFVLYFAAAITLFRALKILPDSDASRQTVATKAA